MEADAVSPEIPLEITGKKLRKQRRRNVTFLVTPGTAHVEEPSLILQNIVSQHGSVKRAAAEKVNQSPFGMDVKLAVTSVKVQTKPRIDNGKIITSKKRIIVIPRFRIDLIKGRKAIIDTQQVGVDQADARRPLPVTRAGVIRLDEEMPGIDFVDIVLNRKGIRLGASGHDGCDVSVRIQVKKIDQVIQRFLTGDLVPFDRRPILKSRTPEITFFDLVSVLVIILDSDFRHRSFKNIDGQNPIDQLRAVPDRSFRDIDVDTGVVVLLV